MAIAPVRKVLIACHKSEEKDFLEKLQAIGVLHIIQKIESQETTLKTLPGKEIIDEISTSIEYLQSFEDKKGFLSGLITEKDPVANNNYLTLHQKYNIDSTTNQIKQFRQTLSNYANQKKANISDIDVLTPWQNLDYSLTEIYDAKKIKLDLGIFSTEPALNETQEAIKDLPAHIEIINKINELHYVIIAYPKELTDEIKNKLQKFEIIDLSRFQGIPNIIIKSLSSQLKKLDNDIQKVHVQTQSLISELPKLKILFDYYSNIESQEDIKHKLFNTTQVVFIEGWVKQKDFKKLKQLVDSFATIILEQLPIQPDEQSPVELENRGLFKPFEMILDFYTMPSSNEIDPTPLLAPFFAIFFALCMSDAAYGTILLIASLILMKKIKGGAKFFKLLAICSAVTIPAGAIMGSWFGDLADKLGIPIITMFRNRFLLFDPIKNPMPFFIISLALGYIHINYGIFIEIYDSIRQKNTQSAIFDQLPWILFLNGIAGYFMAGKFIPITLRPYLISVVLIAMAIIITFTRRNQKLLLNQAFWTAIFFGGLVIVATKFRINILSSEHSNWLIGKYLIIGGLVALSTLSLINLLSTKKFKLIPIFTLALLILSSVGYFRLSISVMPFLLISLIFIMLSTDNRQLIKTLVWGLYTLYGSSSYIGLVLSYIRLMALGMVTAGIAIPINTIAWLLIKVPYVGIVFAIIVLVFGHTYNIAVNILGAFVHSLRLNYVEFFPRFFTGGGEKFSPFQRQTKYVTIK